MDITRIPLKYFLLPLAVLVSALGGLILYDTAARNPFPPEISQNAPYPLYYPSKLPAGYKVDKLSITVVSQTVTYIAKNSQSKEIYFSVQPKPQQQLDDFYSMVLQDKTEILTREGKAFVGTKGQTTQGSLQADQTLVVVTAPGDVPKGGMEVIIKNLKRYERSI